MSQSEMREEEAMAMMGLEGQAARAVGVSFPWGGKEKATPWGVGESPSCWEDGLWMEECLHPR